MGSAACTHRPDGAASIVGVFVARGIVSWYHDSMTQLTLVRGLPGSGKTTFTKSLVKANGDNWAAIAADDYFVIDGTYTFDAARIGEAHAWCLERTRDILSRGCNVVVHNTFSRRWEMQPYMELALNLGAKLTIITVNSDCTDEELAARNEHGCPLPVIRAMRNRWENL